MRLPLLTAQMTVEEKTAQLVTLYGYCRVLDDPLPTPGWKDRVWKDGIGNIDEHFGWPLPNGAFGVWWGEVKIGLPMGPSITAAEEALVPSPVRLGIAG